MVASFLTGSFLTLLIPLALLLVVGVYFWLVTRRRDEF